MTNTLIISAEYIKQNSIIDNNVENENILSSVKKAQDLNIWTSLGSVLYKKILTDIENNSLSGEYKTLVDDYIIPTLLEYSVYYAIPFLQYKITNKSIETKSGENQNPITMEEVVYLRNNILDVAQFYKKRLVDYLVFNVNLFPEYHQNTGADVHPKTKSYSSSVYTPKGDNMCGPRTIILNNQ